MASRHDEILDGLRSRFGAAWEVWTVHRAVSQPPVLWCARRRGWQPGQPVLNEDSPEDLAAAIGQEG